MILELDLGNTRCKWRLREGARVVMRGSMPKSAPFDRLQESIDEYKNKINQVWVASVVNEEREVALSNWCLSQLSVTPQYARSTNQCVNVVNGYEEPARLGVDRWLGIIASNRRFQSSCVIVSFGTAITLDLVTKEGIHLGGFIAPGLNLMLDSLQQKTHKVAPDRHENKFDLNPGRSTTEAVFRAITAMLVGLIENGLAQLRKLNPDEPIKFVFTGGDAEKISAFYPQAEYVPDLVMDGLAYVFNNFLCME